MLKTSSFAFVLAIGATVAGCAADATQAGGMGSGSGSGSGGEGSGSGSGSGSGAPKLDASGKYGVQSQFDIAQNMPGTVGTVVNTFISATDDPDDPTKWVLDMIIAQMPNGTLKSVLQGAEGFVAGYLNDQLTSIAPDFVNTILQVGDAFGDMANHFGLNETLDVSGSGGSYMSVVTATGVHFKIDTTAHGGFAIEEDLAFSDYQLANIVANNVPFTVDPTAKVTIAEHHMPVSYGKVLRMGLDNVIIPLVDPYAYDLPSLLADKVDCAAVGQAISDAVGIGSQGTWQSACDAGLQYGANFIYQKIDDIDASALDFDLTGTAKALDTDHDGKADQLVTGKWAGNLSYSGSPAPLSTATFVGMRM